MIMHVRRQGVLGLWLTVMMLLVTTAVPLLTTYADTRQPTGGKEGDSLIFLPFIRGGVDNAEPGDCFTAEEGTLLQLLNAYRNQNGLPDVPFAKSLTAVAQWHAIDLYNNNPESGTDPISGLDCNLHSWSAQGFWSPVCYTPDHAYASGMWNKPREITSNAYSGNGFENAYRSGGSATAFGAFEGWKNSPGHNDVILEKGVWSNYDWPAMGVGIYENYAVLWFGDQADPQGPVAQCP
jgi:uncharacterized protein YkwD